MNEIKILPFGSGSTGNSVYIEIGPYHLLVDMGIGFRKIRDTLFLYDRDISSIEAIFITHGHYDHIKSAKAIANHVSCDVYCDSSALYPIRDISARRVVIEPYEMFEPLEGLYVTMFSLPHDYVRTNGYIFEYEDKKVGYVTDCGKMNDTILSYLYGSDVVILESNHDVEMLKNGNMEINISEEDYNAVRAALQEQQKIQGDRDYDAYLSRTSEEGGTPLTAEQFQAVRTSGATDLQNKAVMMLLILFPCIAITGPFTAGLSYVTRNWARDEHAFIWTDFKDAVKANWKIPLLLSTITGILPVLIYEGWITYGRMANQNVIMVVPQMLVVMVGAIWALCITYMHPLTVTYDLKVKGVLRNGLLLGIARLPFSVGIRLLHCVPLLIAFIAVWFFGLDPLLGILLLCGYYMIIGFSLSRFITASYTNAVFDRFINPQIEGAKVNQGLREQEDFDDEDDEEEEEIRK